MQTTQLRRIFILAGLLSLFVSYLGVWFQFIQDPVERTGSDFIAFYTAGRIAQEYGPQHVYRVDLQQQVQQEEVGFQLVEGQVLLYNHLPFLIPLLQGIVNTDYVASFYRWVVLLITVYVAAVTILSFALAQTGVDRMTTLLMASGALLFLPVFFSLMNGQDTALLLLGVALWAYGYFCGQEILSGLGLSLTTVRPHIALLLAIPLVFRHPKTFLVFLLGSGTLALLSLFILGQNGVQEFINILLISAGGEWYGMKENVMYNLIGMLTRVLPQIALGTIRALGWIVYAMTIIWLSVLWRRNMEARAGPIGLTVILALFVVPHLHFHDLALLLIPMYELLRRSQKTGGLKTSILIIIPIAFSLFLLLSNISSYLHFTIPYLMMAMLAVYPHFLNSNPTVTTPHRS